MRKGHRGSSLQTVLAILALMTVLAAGMVAVYTSSLNHVQAFANGEIAQSEADSAINELIARLNENPSFGSGEEEIRGTRSPGLSAEEAFHVLTFTGSGGFPASTNATSGSTAGSLGRSIPNGHIHAVATGYCKGQFRTVEALLEHPPFPYGLASSGAIHSETPIIVKGTSQNWTPGNETRPGHLVSNSRQGVSIGSEGGAATFITGFIKSRGPISVDQPATVLEGLFPHANGVDLPSINLESEFANEGAPGVAEILDSEFPGQTLDVMYHSNHSVTYNGSVAMDNAFLFCRGDVTIYGGLTGVGAIVALGDVNINGATNFDGTNNVAILARGRIRLSGGGNFFRGVIYAEEGIDARNVTIVGNAIANNQERPEAASVRLEDVILISSEETSTLEFIARSRRTIRRQNNEPQIPFQVTLRGGQFPNGGQDGATIGERENIGMSRSELESSLSETLNGLWPASGPSDITWNGNFDGAIAGSGVTGIAGHFQTAFTILANAQELEEEADTLRDKDPRTPDENQRLAEIPGEISGLRNQFQSAIEQAKNAYMAYVDEHTGPSGSYLGDGFHEPDIFVPYTIDLNKYLPQAENFRVSYYNVYGRKL